MEAASRPVLEPLADLPVEAPIEGGISAGRPTPAQAAPGAFAGASASAGASTPSEQAPKAQESSAADELIDPESLLGPPPPLEDVRVPKASHMEVKEEL